MTTPTWPTVRVAVSAESVDWVSGELWAWGCTGIAEEPMSDDTVTLVAGFPSFADAEAAALAVSGTCVVVDGADWLDAWREHFEPLRVGALLIAPSWKIVDATTERGETRIDLDPGRAFGTGAHASTRLALALLQHIPVDGVSLLDVGCGSGVLSVAAARLGAAKVTGIDIEDEAVRVTNENAVRNGVAERVRVSTQRLEALDGPFDVVVANILAPVLIELAPAIAAHVGATLILAGLIEDQVGRVLAAYPQLTLVERIDEPPWVGLLLSARVDLAQP